MKKSESKGTGKLAAVGVGAGIGAALGSTIGIAGFFGAISGALPLAIIGGYIAHRASKAAGEEFAQGASEGFAEKAEELRAKRKALRASVGMGDPPHIPPTSRKPPSGPTK